MLCAAGDCFGAITTARLARQVVDGGPSPEDGEFLAVGIVRQFHPGRVGRRRPVANSDDSSGRTNRGLQDEPAQVALLRQRRHLLIHIGPSTVIVSPAAPWL